MAELALDIGLQLQQLKLATDYYRKCTDILSSVGSSELIEKQLREQLDAYHKERWQLAEQTTDPFKRLLMGPEGRTFQYVSEAKISEIFNSKKPQKCSICHEQQPLTLTYWVSSDHLVLCPACIASGQTKRYKGLLFHPLENFAYNTSIPFYQVYLLAVRTPPIGSFCKQHDTYRWARHCGDFALYLGDVDPKQMDYETLEILANEEGGDANNIIEWYGTPYGNTYIHQFECLYCKKILYTLDYPL
jgi:uncharacterized protein CbrC (UPF0167 family)